MNPEHTQQELKQLFLDQKFSNRVSEFVGQFYQDIISQRVYMWLGLFETLDSTEKTHWIVFLQPKQRILNLDQLRMLPAFIDLSLLMRGETFQLDLAFTRRQTYQDSNERLQECVENVRETYGESGPRWPVITLWQRDF